MAGKNVQQIYDSLNGFLCEDTQRKEEISEGSLFTRDSDCSRVLEAVYRKRHELLDRGVSERDLDVIFDGFERLMRRIGERMYLCGELSARRLSAES